jgi:hypoxanthine phosphoribosyltransferase
MNINHHSYLEEDNGSYKIVVRDITGAIHRIKANLEDVDRRKNILIVDDINDTGATFNWILNDWPSGCFPNETSWNTVWDNNVKFAVLVDNLASKCERKMDFWGMEINKAEDNVWVDFPWEDWWTK